MRTGGSLAVGSSTTSRIATRKEGNSWPATWTLRDPGSGPVVTGISMGELMSAMRRTPNGSASGEPRPPSAGVSRIRFSGSRLSTASQPLAAAPRGRGRLYADGGGGQCGYSAGTSAGGASTNSAAHPRSVPHSLSQKRKYRP